MCLLCLQILLLLYSCTKEVKFAGIAGTLQLVDSAREITPKLMPSIAFSIYRLTQKCAGGRGCIPDPTGWWRNICFAFQSSLFALWSSDCNVPVRAAPKCTLCTVCSDCQNISLLSRCFLLFWFCVYSFNCVYYFNITMHITVTCDCDVNYSQILLLL